jgi:hypothetical protein
MIIKNTSQSKLDQALVAVNKVFEDNIKFKRCEYMGGTRSGGEKWRVTLTVKDSHKAGSRVSPWNGHRMACVCWHVHGTYIDSLFDSCPELEIKTMGITLYHKRDNWHDKNIGSVYHPFNFSESCECE